jgi:hypothetical protein
MPPIIPDEVPTIMVAGTTVKFHRSFDDFQASDGWGYTFYANGAANIFNKAASINPDGNSFDIVLDASLTASIAPGRYTVAERLSNSITSEVVHPTRDLQQLLIEGNVATASAGAYISHIERTLAVIEAAIEGQLTTGMLSYQIAGRSVVKIQPKELLQFRGYYKSKLWRLQNPGQLGAPVLITFSNEAEDPTFPPTWVDVTGVGL